MSDGMERPASALSPLKRALLSIEALQARVQSLEGARAEPIAIIGTSCRLPGGAHDPESFFRALLDERDGIQPRPPVARPGWPDDGDERAATLPPAGYLDYDVRGFDAPFFGISPREATSIDPQHRLLLECAWEALEAAGIDPHSLERSQTGVFVGMAANDYAQMQLRSARASQLLHSHFAAGIGHSMVSGRLSYLLGLQGPSITLDTACSSSLVGVHLACQSLRTGETNLAVAAGVNLILATDYTVAFQQSRMLSADGRCRTFDATADGFSRAEGCGVVVLKRLADAQREGDRVLAVIRASAVNQDGPSSGLTAPSGPAQVAVIRAALSQANLQPRDIGYVEAHGTATSLGDPIEMQALGAVFNDDRSDDEPLLVGSVKTNFGHLEAAAGIAGLIKLVEAIRHGEIPAHLHFTKPSPHIPWSDLRVAVPTTRTPFPITGGTRRGGVSSFGFSGTNAHVIVEQAPSVDTGDDDGVRADVLTLSAADGDALRELAVRYAARLRRATDRLSDVCHTANIGRAHLTRRLALVATDCDDAAQLLESWLRAEAGQAVREAQLRGPDRPAIAFLFTGQGAQYAGMGWSLRTQSRVFREALGACDDILRTELDVPLLDVLDPTSPHAALVNRTDYTQPAIFALQYALTMLWQSRGVRPAVVAGHSIGEFAAAHLAGVFGLEDALRLVALRGRLMQGVRESGRMEAIFAGEERVRGWLEEVGGAVSVAGINAADQIVVSGATESIAAVVELARAGGVTTRPLRTSQAFHSPLMDDVVREFGAAVAAVSLQPGNQVRIVSTVTGSSIAPDQLADPRYWARQLREPVRFADAAMSLAELASIGVEIGPHPSLAGLVAQNGIALPVCASLQREKDEWTTFLTTTRDLYLAGVVIDWRAAAEGARPRPVALPTYPFQRVPLWVDLGFAGTGVQGGHPLLGHAVAQPGDARAFERTLTADAPAFIGEHRVLGSALMPGAAFIEMMLAAGQQTFGHAVEVVDLDLVEPMSFAADEHRRVHSRVEMDGGEARVTIHSTPEPAAADSTWTLHASGHVRRAETAGTRIDLDAVTARLERRIAGVDFRKSLQPRGYDFGPRLHGVITVAAGTGEALGSVGLPPACAEDAERYTAHPLILDAGLQIASCAIDGRADVTYLPMAIGRIVAANDVMQTTHVHVRIVEQRDRMVTADAQFCTADGRVVAMIERVLFREVSRADLDGVDDPFLVLQWEEDTRVRAGAPAVTIPAADAADVVHRSLRHFAAQENATDYDHFVDTLEAESGQWVCHAFRRLGWEPQPGRVFDAGALTRQLGVVPERERLLARMFGVLEEEGIVQRTSDGWRVLRALPAVDVTALSTVDPRASGNGAAPEAVLLRRCGPHLADGLRGTIDPLTLLFPGGDGSLAEQMYYDAPLARMLNGAIVDTVAGAIARAPAGRTIRVLEVGGGTGGTTRRLVERLYATADARPPLQYTFTDVSPMFVERARTRFAHLPGFEFATFDLDRAPEGQGHALGEYDIVIAANCLHAARDVTEAARRVQRLLRPGGMLIAAEVFAPYRWFDLTVGLTDGWWHFTDTQLRPSYACLPAPAWKALLTDAGFENTIVMPLADAAGTSGRATRHQGLVVSFRTTVQTSEPDADAWLLVSDDDDELTTAIAVSLDEIGIPVTRLSADVLGAATDPAGEVAKVLQGRRCWAGVLHHARTASCGPIAAATVDQHLRSTAGTLLSTAQAVTAFDGPVGRLCLLTRNAQLTGRGDTEIEPVAASSAGLVRAIAAESPDLPCFALDLDASADVASAAEVVSWMRAERDEPELAIRGGRSFVPRMQSRAGESVAGLPAEYRLTPARRGSIDNLEWSDGERTPPAAGQVEIRVVASALNFKDVLNVLDMYPGDPGALGSECAGIVTRVGDGVSFAVGDEVIAAAGGAYGRHVIADATLVARKPARLTFAQAATLPIAYLTSHFALNHLGDMRAGDRVLIHSAAGGVGLAACALAQRAGAEIYATAGSDAKRDMLRRHGVRHVFDSRSLSFADDVMAATEGRGVTMVLNSLADEFVERSFSVIADRGRFLEIGKRGIWTPAQVEALGRAIEYHVIDWGATAQHEPQLMGRLFAEVVEAVQAGELEALPFTTFPLHQVRDAFRYMAQAKHTGKVVLEHAVVEPSGPIEFHAGGTYLVTGGTSGLGLATAGYAASRGARTLVLVSRGKPAPAAASEIDGLRDTGVAVHVMLADVGAHEQMKGVIDFVRRELPPLRGIIHAAGALADRTLQTIGWDDFATVMRAKVVGTVLLDELTRDCALDFFVAYSSIASVLGSPGQSNHSTANAFLDAYVARRWTTGQQCMSIAWGPWSETGSATREDLLARNRERGLEPLTTADGLQWLERALARPATLLIGARITRPAALAANGRHERLLQRLAGEQKAAPSSTAAAVTETAAQSLHDQLATVPAGVRRTFVVNRVKTRVRAVLGLPASFSVEIDRPLGELGLDSLLAIELRNVLGEDVGRRLPATLLFDHPTTAALADALLALLDPPDDAVQQAVPAGGADHPFDAVESLSDDDVDRLLAEKLKQS